MCRSLPEIEYALGTEEDLAETGLDTELEAVRSDITAAREYPQQTLGIDLMSFGHWPDDRMASSLRGQPLITGVPEQFTTERMALTRCHDAYLDALASEGRQPREDTP